MTQMPAISIESITALAMPPVEFIELAAELGCEYVSLAARPMTANPHGYPAWSLADDAALRRETVAALARTGIKIASADGVFIRPGADAASLAATLDVYAEIGTRIVNAVSFEPDAARNIAMLAALSEMAAERGMRTAIEFVPGLPVGDLPSAMAAVRGVGRSDFGVTIDPMHVFRSGGTVADVAALAPGEIGHVQMCDVPWVSSFESYGREALDARLAPGDGELPLDELVAVLPPVAIVGIEVPQLALAEAGVGPRERLKPVIAATRALLERAGARA